MNSGLIEINLANTCFTIWAISTLNKPNFKKKLFYLLKNKPDFLIIIFRLLNKLSDSWFVIRWERLCLNLNKFNQNAWKVTSRPCVPGRAHSAKKTCILLEQCESVHCLSKAGFNTNRITFWVTLSLEKMWLWSCLLCIN